MYDNIDLTFICGQGCEDWVPEVTAEQRAERVLAAAEDGQIVLLHDMQWNQNTVEALKTIIPELKKRGYEFVTVPQLFELKNITPRRGWLYTNVLQTASDNRL
jgi:peptidoglycan/xylan/chitin deacetylase (PgdA/CDA1 family)